MYEGKIENNHRNIDCFLRGPSIKYVTLEGRVLRRWDSLWQREG